VNVAHTLGCPEQRYPDSTAQLLEHPSFEVTFASSHVSVLLLLRRPSPHASVIQLEVHPSPFVRLPSSQSSRDV
jgi:hypothetical protein